MLITLALDVLAAYLLARFALKWWAWLPASLLLGAVISLAYFLTAGFLGFLTPGNAAYQGIYNVPLNAGACALYSWWLRRSKA
jgi:ABC-type glycerol-3-phosphate transport system permease component